MSARPLGLALALALALAPTLASADAVGPPRVSCPPGTTRVPSHAGGACIPRACSITNDHCGAGARCRAFGECVAMRPGTGRFGPSAHEVRVGICGADDHCDEGSCRHVQQCEPTERTPAWDRRLHQWTGRPHPRHTEAGPWLGGVMLAALALVLARRVR